MTQQARDAIGPAAWLQLCAHFGGQELRIPKTRQSAVWRELCAHIGPVAADALVALYGNDVLSVPLGAHINLRQRMQHLYRLRQQGAGINDLVKASRHERVNTARTIKRQLAAMRTEAAQPTLFEGEGE